ncbi:carbohydrate-binding module family 20 protein [Dothidotthia symphoricarpi CBS 119687]|uniref:Glucoamylase n=1 Tax=Dothidotthia symphoricarpi CBS 119687 TaxID=1392245 RepID=A0A6A6A9R3_9PLEO|nr:carbohydrate-binding module family 20 protein [Dothidotthia symphoricarpi CBS 119687]KAF2128682.1 carbohydrate-binding module family 20 protein [Dothidotthia symphoricarpi CBS 119687]
MLFSSVLRAIPAAFLLSSANASPVESQARALATIDQFVKTQTTVSINGVLANIGTDGSKAQGVPAGIVLASPSRSDPDYYYTWTRDAALTYKALIERFVTTDKSLRQKIDDYVSAQAYLQTVSNPSGSPDAGGLGEPKFNVNRTAFTGSWGRPQRDGPPLRATALTIYANWLIDNGGRTQALNTVWPVIAKDLVYTVRYWNQTGFDLWEEINGSSFFTLSATHRALVEGAALATKLGQTCDGCATAAPQVLCFLKSFWANGYIDSNINVNDGRVGKDVNSILSSIHTFDPSAKCTDATFQPCSSHALANHKAVTDSFRSVYAINKGIPQGQAVAVGRYSEDVYYNGNPWYLATLAAAEQMYSAAYQWNQTGSITIDSVSLPFFRDLMPSVAVGTYNKTSSTYATIISAVRTYGDGYIAMVQKYTPANGGLAEQFNKATGAPLSAVDLTWSYAAFLTAAERRDNIVGPTWGEPSNNVAPASCTAAPSCNSRITFNVRATTVLGENIFIAGQATQLGNWAPADAAPLSASKYTSSDPLWTATIDMPAATVFEYKYIRKSSSGVVTWESDPNRRYTTAGGCGSSSTINDTWR